MGLDTIAIGYLAIDAGLALVIIAVIRIVRIIRKDRGDTPFERQVIMAWNRVVR